MAISGYGGVDKFKVLDLILEFADQSFLRAHCLIQLHLLLLNEVSVSLDVLQFLLEDGELLLLILVLFLFDLTSLFVFLKLPDLLILLSQFIVELEDCLPVLQFHLVCLSFGLLIHLLTYLLDSLLMLSPQLVHLLALVDEFGPQRVFDDSI